MSCITYSSWVHLELRKESRAIDTSWSWLLGGFNLGHDKKCSGNFKATPSKPCPWPGNCILSNTRMFKRTFWQAHNNNQTGQALSKLGKLSFDVYLWLNAIDHTHFFNIWPHPLPDCYWVHAGPKLQRVTFIIHNRKLSLAKHIQQFFAYWLKCTQHRPGSQKVSRMGKTASLKWIYHSTRLRVSQALVFLWPEDLFQRLQ